jgi:hypothetical protein
MITETDVIDAMELLRSLTVPAGELNVGDQIVYRRDDGIHVSEVASVTPAANFGPDGVTITTIHGDAWSCSPRNTGQYCLPVVLDDSERNILDRALDRIAPMI